MNWLNMGFSIGSALAGGFVGGWVVAFRLGRWRQWVDDSLRSMEKRLGNGDRLLDIVPVINARLDMVLDEIRAIKAAMREDRQQFVSREECNRRHDSQGG